MSKRIDLVGQKFGYLTVISLDEERTNNNKRTYWFCKCDCGNPEIKSIRCDQLSSGRTKSCGCYNRKMASERMKKISQSNQIKEDLTGKIFGYWYVQNRAENKNNHVAWNCICKCGTKRVVLGQSLKNGKSQSCGCLKISHGQKKIFDLLTNANIPFQRQYVVQDLFFTNMRNKARFDFYINNKYFVEYDGQQHFLEKDKEFFKHGFKTIKQHDTIKNQYCIDNNIPLIRIPYTHYKDLCLEDLLLETSSFRIN